MSYIACRPMKVKTKTGDYVVRRAGEPIPEAENFPNPALWVKRGYMKRADGKTTVPERGRYVPPRAATPADFEHREERQALKEQGVEPEKVPFEPASPANIGPGDGKESAAVDFGDEPEAAPEVPIDPLDKLMAMTRKQLAEMAGRYGIAVGTQDSKESIAKAILDGQ